MGPRQSRSESCRTWCQFRRSCHRFRGCLALTREDPDSAGEQRFITLGMSSVAHLLVVVYTYREPEIIRIISAWRANRRQRIRYEKDRR
jgi:uncharacterized DUF497 family protein